jgi:hypothetical protein
MQILAKLFTKILLLFCGMQEVDAILNNLPLVLMDDFNHWVFKAFIVVARIFEVFFHLVSCEQFNIWNSPANCR